MPVYSMMKRKLIIAVCLLLVPAGCATSTFIVSNGIRGYYFGSESEGAYMMLCESGELEKVLGDAALPEEVRQDFYAYVCTEQRSQKKVTSLYTFLTPEEKKSLKQAFVRHGYTINAVPC